jgi:lipopolysaccharide transport system ATP-binding protein
MELAIQAAGVGKQYALGRAERYQTLRDTVAGVFSRSIRRFTPRVRGRTRSSEPATFWALRNVSFDIPRGEVVGLIGRNGAGKSTLLKILSRITTPTEGVADISGRVGSLLEVGTGFHPELSGQDNIYLSGAILGMKRAEIARKFDEIVAFAEVERFVHTSVKHYSSGMYLRLAFAVAAHLEPEILLVDEVLAVGDARFQRKCLDKMQDVGNHGRTVVFVSHNMSAITRLCQTAILLEDGTVARYGPAQDVVASYLNSGLGTSAVREWPDAERAPGTDTVRLRAIRIRDDQGNITDSVDIRRPVAVEIEYDVLRPGHVLWPHYLLHNAQGITAFVGSDQDPAWRRKPRPVGRYRSTGWIPGNLLSEGTMLIGPAMRSLEPNILHCYERDVVGFQVNDCTGGDTARGDYPDAIPGVVRPLMKWTTDFQPLDTDTMMRLPPSTVRTSAVSGDRTEGDQ